jgi:penicillin-binding protein 1A
MLKKIFKTVLWGAVAGGVALFGFLLYLYSEIRFEVDQIVDYNPKLTTTIYDRNGKLIANLFDEHRVYVAIEEVPGRLIEALVAIEDTKFYEHSGINVDAIIRAIIKDIQARAFVEGASTLTQQLVKTKLLSRDKKIMRKIKEVLLAMRLETILSKDEILERYLNEVYFGHGYYGVKTAANGYFDKELKDLTLKESAMLVSLPKAPSFYDPTKRYEENIRRANSVITRMRDLGWIDETSYLQAIQEMPKVYDKTLSENKAPYVVDEVLRRFNKDDIRSGGYKIETTIDLDAQQIARDALTSAYEKIISRDINATGLNGALIVTQKGNGDILALVGGVNYNQSNFNRATQSKRQPGSSFKPFIYQAALNLGYSPASQLYDVARTYDMDNGEEDEKWQPKNYGESFSGVITLKEALVHSKNLATINLVQSIGFKNLATHLAPLDIDIPQNLSVALGNVSASPIEMAKFYSIFINYGQMIEPRLIVKVHQKDALIYENEVSKFQYTTPEQAFLTVDILHEAVKNGTGRGVRIGGIELAGKTGTTNENVDAWFCGFSPSIQAVAWFGRDDNTPIGKYETGGRAAGPAFKAFFQNYLQKHPELDRKFEVPKGVYKGQVDAKEYYHTDISRLPSKNESFDDSLIF